MPLHVLGPDFAVSDVHSRGPDGHTFTFEGFGGRWPNLPLPILGPHQVRNAAVALEALAVAGERDSRLRVSLSAVRRGLSRVRAEGRLQIVDRRPWVVVDGAHNDASMRATMETMRDALPHDRLAVVLGTMQDKDLAGMLDALVPAADAIFPVRVDLARAVRPEVLARRVRDRARRVAVRLAGRPVEAIERAREAVGPDGAVLVTGSMVLAGHVLRALDV